jgi:hypothetical protein
VESRCIFSVCRLDVTLKPVFEVSAAPTRRLNGSGRLCLVQDESVSAITAGPDVSQLVKELQPYRDAGMVADIGLADGTITTGILIGVSFSALVLDHWDEQAHRPAGNPFTLALDLVSNVVIP